MRRDIFLKIEPIREYSPLAPLMCSRKYGRDCMYNEGHEYGRVKPEEIFSTMLDAIVYREYLDPDYSKPSTAKIIEADINEPPWNRRVPGAVIFTKPGEKLHIHVYNSDKDECHSFHLHGLRYGIDSDGAWPFGLPSTDGRRSDEILPGQEWTYIFDVMPETIGAWAFHDHVRHVQQNVSRGLFGGIIVRDPLAPCVDHEIPLFVHQMAGISTGYQFESPTLSPRTASSTFSYTFGTNLGITNYYCRIHGPSMSGQVHVVSSGPILSNVSMHDNQFDPNMVNIGPGGTVTWNNIEAEDNHNHIVFSGGGGTSTYCLNGRTYIGNTPTVDAEAGEKLRWYVFNLDLGGVWHNFHPHSSRWQLPTSTGGASDVHSLSPTETFVMDTEVPLAVRLPCILDEFQCEPPKNSCRVRLKADFLFHCHIEEHMMRGLVGLLRSRQYVWVNEEIVKKLSIELPYDDGLNECPALDLVRCQTKMTHPHQGARVKPTRKNEVQHVGGVQGDSDEK